MSLKKGFTLMEIVYVLALVSTLGVLGFISWKKMIDRAHSIEAQAYVGFVYAAQKQYYNECNHFYPDLEVIQGMPQGVLSYNVGGIPDAGDFPCPSDNPTCEDSCGIIPHSCGRPGGKCLSSLDKIYTEYENSIDSLPFVFKDNAKSSFDDHYPDITAKDTYTSAMGVSGDVFKVGRKYFFISAIKKIEPSKWDVWTIDHRGVLTNAKVVK